MPLHPENDITLNPNPNESILDVIDLAGGLVAMGWAGRRRKLS